MGTLVAKTLTSSTSNPYAAAGQAARTTTPTALDAFSVQVSPASTFLSPAAPADFHTLSQSRRLPLDVQLVWPSQHMKRDSAACSPVHMRCRPCAAATGPAVLAEGSQHSDCHLGAASVCVGLPEGCSSLCRRAPTLSWRTLRPSSLRTGCRRSCSSPPRAASLLPSQTSLTTPSAAARLAPAWHEHPPDDPGHPVCATCLYSFRNHLADWGRYR